MRLLFDATELSYYNENSGHRAGVFYVALNLLREFEKLGVDITLICDFKRYYFLKNIDEFKKYTLLKENSFMNKFVGKVLYLIRNCPLKIQYSFLILARYYDSLRRFVNKNNMKQLNEFDAYFSPFTPPSVDIQKSKLKRFRMIHDVIPIVEKGFPKSPKDWHYKIYSTINSEDFYVTNSEFTKQDVLKHFPFIKDSHIKSTLLGANGKFYKTDEKSTIQEPYVFSLCTLGKRKNLIFTIKNFFEFIEKNKINNLKLVLGGGVWAKFEKELSSVLSRYDSSRVVVTGYIGEDELNKYYSNALCFIYPSLYEGFGLPVLEAMQCGCPVITSDKTSLPEVIGDCGIMINPAADNELINAFEKMYFDQNFREQCSRKGLERAKQFSWQKCALELLEFIKTNCV